MALIVLTYIVFSLACVFGAVLFFWIVLGNGIFPFKLVIIHVSLVSLGLLLFTWALFNPLLKIG